jgi:putative peptide zinc metalloprotease protein
MSSGNMVASNERPIPLRKRADLKVALIEYLGVGYEVIKDPVGLKYHRLQVEQFKILELLDGERSLEQIRDELKIIYPTLQVTLSDIQQLITDLHKKGLVVSDRAGQGAGIIRERTKQRNDKIKQTLMSLLYMRLPGWDPERTLRWLYPWMQWMFHRWIVTVCMLFVTSAWLLLGANLDEFQGRLPEFQSFFGWPNLMYMWVTLGAAKIVHEFGHGLSCHHYGGECHEMGIMLLVFSPCLYCDVTDSWMLRSKWQRIIIGAAGMYIEVIISAFAIYIWWFSKPGLVHHLALNMFFVTTITTVIFNANPLMRFDGYYMMSDFLEIPNLRQKSDKMLREAFSWYCLGIESRPDPFMPETGKAWFVTYAIAAWLYRWVILVSISMFLYTVLKPYDLQSIGITLMFVSMAGIFFSMFRNIYQILATPRNEPMSKIKIGVSLAVLGSFGYLAVAIPIPWHHEAPFFLEPQRVVVVPAPFTGRLVTAEEYKDRYDNLVLIQDFVVKEAVRQGKHDQLGDPEDLSLVAGLPTPMEFERLPDPGQYVNNEDVLAIIEDGQDIQRREDLVQSAFRWLARRDELFRHRAQLDISSENDVVAEVVVLEEHIKELVRLSTQRIVRYAGKPGQVVAAKRIPEPPINEIDPTRLERWHGTPLDHRNIGCLVEVGQELMSIAPGSPQEPMQLQAVLYVDQGDRDDLQDEMEVELKLDHLADITYRAPVSRISQRGDVVAPEALTTRFDGPLATKPNQQGQETLASTAYRATVILGKDVSIMKPGMRGLARFKVGNRTAWQWAWRYLNETFRFRLG